MKVSGGLTEDGIVVGNTYDKYNSRNPVVKHLMRGFDDALSALVMRVQPKEIHEIGCGEGYWSLRWCKENIAVRGSDFSRIAIDLARANAIDRNLSAEMFNVTDIYDLQPQRDRAELVVCCEVLEHLDEPEAGLRALRGVADPYLILSVPREPIWSAMNMMRGKYWSQLGNTPGHLQRWSTRQFVRLVSRHFDVIATRTPLPWTMLLCRQKQVRSAGF
jgi:2-polyprenyl-3-methyl-5-hydroxy-6-metoxy-1,4-benzoquinol methylase